MSKIIVVGHPSVDVAPLNEALRAAGVSSAEFSKRSPQEIDEIITTVSQNDTAVPVIWNGLALELLLDNIHQPLWGWSNSQALFSLDYWKSVDSSFSFILSYESPTKVLMDKTNDSQLEERLNEWVSYHQKLLQFYLDNRDTSVLLHQAQFNIDIQNSMRLLEGGIQGLEYIPTKKSADLSINSDESLKSYDISPFAENNGDDIQMYLLDHVIQEFPTVVNLYEKLQAVADIPLKDQIMQRSPIEVWESFNQYQQKNSDEHEQLNLALKSSKEEGTLLLEQLHIAQEEVESLFGENRNFVADLNLKDQRLEEKNRELAELEAANVAAISKQEDIAGLLDKAQQESIKNEQKIQQLSADKITLEQNQKTLQQQIGSINNKAEKENLELLRQMHLVQEELEKIYLQTRDKELKKQQGPFGAADRIKSQLSYRIGATLIDNSKSFTGCLLMPFKLFSTYRTFKVDRKNQPKLPAIHTYQDYYDVARIQGHLSYRLGSYFIKNIKKPWKWFVMPFQMRSIVKDFRSAKK